jgi:general secretion pathway protein K
MLDKIKDFVIFLPIAGTKVNVNTAPAEVLAAIIDTLSLSEAASLVANRNTAAFLNVGDFTNRLPGKPISTSGIDVSTNFFLVNGKVRMSRAGLEVQALVERNASGKMPTIIQIREY